MQLCGTHPLNPHEIRMYEDRSEPYEENIGRRMGGLITLLGGVVIGWGLFHAPVGSAQITCQAPLYACPNPEHPELGIVQCCHACSTLYWSAVNGWQCRECGDAGPSVCELSEYPANPDAWICCVHCAQKLDYGDYGRCRDCLTPGEVLCTEDDQGRPWVWACCADGCSDIGGDGEGSYYCVGPAFTPTPDPNATPTPDPHATPTPNATPADVYTVHVAPSVGCTVFSADGGIDVVETPNGIACAGTTPADDPLCTEQFRNFDITMLKVVTDLGYEFTGWTVNGAPAKRTTGTLVLASHADSLSPGTTEMNVEIGCPPQPTVEIVSADVTQNQIQIQLGPAGAAGTLTLELRDPDTHQIRSEERTGSLSSLQETFDINNLTVGEYQYVKATWNIGGVSATGEFAYHIKVLGMYNHTRYNTPTEEFCDGTNITLHYTEGGCQAIQQCSWTEGTGISGWLDEIVENGSGYSATLGYVSLEWFCQNPNATYRLRRVPNPCPQCGGNLVVDVSVARSADNIDLPCGARVYVHTVGVVTVQDAGGRVAMHQLDHYAGNGGCNHNAGTIGQRMTIRLY